MVSPEEVSCNLISTVSDHLPQFMIAPNVFWKPSSKKANIFERDCLNFDQQNFILDNFAIDWNCALKLDEQNVDYSTESFSNKSNLLLSNYCPLKKIRKEKIKFSFKPVDSDLFKNVNINQNKFLNSFIKKKDPAKKQNSIYNTKTTEAYYQSF